jgi:carbon-monoxide dehydrogenase iron sulfur subunit
MTKVLIIEYEKCVGCRTCEMACSAKHTATINPHQSRISVVKWDMDGEGIPIACSHCESAPCQAICPVTAIARDEPLGRVMIDYDKCIGCRLCVAVCPFGAISFDSIARKVIKCDLCEGDPLCVRFCSYGALKYLDASEHTIQKRREVAEEVKGIVSMARTRWPSEVGQ